MINLNVDKSDVDPNLLNFSVSVDSGTSISSHSLGLVYKEDLELILADLFDDIQRVAQKFIWTE